MTATPDTRTRTSDSRTAGFTAEHRPADAAHAGAPTTVFLSALFAGRWIWDAPFAALTAAGRPALRVNEPVCAADGRVAGSIALLGDALVGLCDEAGVDRMVLCANSMGGMVAIDLAARLPERVAGIVVSGAPGLTPDPDIGLRMDQRTAGMMLSGPQFEERMMAALFHRGRHLTDEQMHEVGGLLDRPATMVAVARGIRATRTYPVGRSLESVRCPSLYLWGAHDRMTPVDPWVALIEDHPTSELVVVPECGHIPMLETADDYSARLLEFVARLDAAPVPATPVTAAAAS